MGPQEKVKFCCDGHRKRYGARKVRAAARDRSNWWVPEAIRARVRAEHPITMDSAASRQSTWVPSNWFGPQHPDRTRWDALDWDWSQVSGGGEVWSCPPFRPWQDMVRFVRRAVETAQRGTGVVALLPYSPGALWYRKYVTGCKVVRVTEQPLYPRVRFEGPHATGRPAPYDVVLIHWKAADRPLLAYWPLALWPRPVRRPTRGGPGDRVWFHAPQAVDATARVPRVATLMC